MSYQKDLDFLIRGIGAEAFQGGDALQMLMQARADRDERRYARKQAAQTAQSDVLDALVTTAKEGATSGMTLEDLTGMLQAEALFSGAPAPAVQGAMSTLAPGLEALYPTPQGPYAPEYAAQLQATSTSPYASAEFDDKDEAAIANLVNEQLIKEGPAANVAGILAQVRDALGPDYEENAPLVDQIVYDTFSKNRFKFPQAP